MGTVMKSSRPTLDNDGSVSDDPCQECDGRLVLRAVRSGGFFLGCSKYPKGCTFKMAPNPHQMEALETARAERRAARAEARRIKDEALAEKAKEKARLTPPPTSYCDGCYSALSNVDVQARRVRHSWC